MLGIVIFSFYINVFIMPLYLQGFNKSELCGKVLSISYHFSYLFCLPYFR